MRRLIFLVLVFSFCAGQVYAAKPSPDFVLTRDELRAQFKLAREDKNKARELLSLIEKSQVLSQENCPAIVMAYYGALQGLEAKFVFFPTVKWQHLAASLQWLDRAAALDRQDLEVRFVRFATLQHLPSFLGVGDKRKQDLDFLCEQLLQADYSKIDRQTQAEMTAFLLDSDRLDAGPKKRLENLRAGGEAR